MTTTTAVTSAAPRADQDVQIHPLSRRIMHWINALAILIMIGSGWRIYDYYPALPIEFGFPYYLTLGGDITLTDAINNEYGLANALAWHFAAMWVLVINLLAYLIVGIVSGHFRRDFLPVSGISFARDFLAALRGKLGHRLGEYNAVQKVFYWGVIAAILLTIASGLSIWKPVQLQELTWLFGGYEFARVVHFFGMLAIVGFLIVHVALTILVPRTLVAMVLGRASEPLRTGNGGER
jgi:thiosulfate reductase cytochrome b subunit